MNTVKSHRVLAEHSKWVGKSQVAVKVRKIGYSDKIAVDLLVFSPQVTYGPSEVQLRKIACNAVASCGAASFDYSVLCNFEVDRKIHQPDGSLAGIHIRKLSLAFHGVEE